MGKEIDMHHVECFCQCVKSKLVLRWWKQFVTAWLFLVNYYNICMIWSDNHRYEKVFVFAWCGQACSILHVSVKHICLWCWFEWCINDASSFAVFVWMWLLIISLIWFILFVLLLETWYTGNTNISDD